VRRYDPLSGAVTTMAGSGVAGRVDAVGAAARLNSPLGPLVSADGATLFFADWGSHTVRAMTIPDGAVTTVAGTGAAGWFDAPVSEAVFNNPAALSLSPSGALLVAEGSGAKLRSVDLLAAGGGAVETLAGSGTAGFLDGPAVFAAFNAPRGLAVVDAFTVFVADTANHRVRRYSCPAPSASRTPSPSPSPGATPSGSPSASATPTPTQTATGTRLSGCAVNSLTR
jgi:hypothetical protein